MTKIDLLCNRVEEDLNNIHLIKSNIKLLDLFLKISREFNYYFGKEKIRISFKDCKTIKFESTSVYLSNKTYVLSFLIKCYMIFEFDFLTNVDSSNILEMFINVKYKNIDSNIIEKSYFRKKIDFLNMCEYTEEMEYITKKLINKKIINLSIIFKV